MAQCYQASICGSVLCIRHQYGCASCINMAQCCALCITMAHFCSMISIMDQYCSVLCIMYLNYYGSILCIMAECCASTAHWCASGINMAQCYVSGINMAQCYVSGINVAQCCPSGINEAVHHASVFDAVHPRLNDVHQASVWFIGCVSGIKMAQCCVAITLWPGGVHQTSQYSSNLCIMYQLVGLYRCGASITQAVHQASM